MMSSKYLKGKFNFYALNIMAFITLQYFLDIEYTIMMNMPSILTQLIIAAEVFN